MLFSIMGFFFESGHVLQFHEFLVVLFDYFYSRLNIFPLGLFFVKMQVESDTNQKLQNWQPLDKMLFLIKKMWDWGKKFYVCVVSSLIH